jgi:hypothetical protein
LLVGARRYCSQKESLRQRRQVLRAGDRVAKDLSAAAEFQKKADPKARLDFDLG